MAYGLLQLVRLGFFYYIHFGEDIHINIYEDNAMESMNYMTIRNLKV